jgi:signal peptidase II
MIVLLVLGGVSLLLDQWSKRLVQVHLGDRCVSWGPILRIRCVNNVKEIFRRDGARALLVLVWLTAFLSAIALYRSGAWFQSRAALLGLGLAFGGAAGNLMDVLRRRCVIDFIDLRWWPVFNLADVAIVGGLVTALWPRI